MRGHDGHVQPVPEAAGASALVPRGLQMPRMPIHTWQNQTAGVTAELPEPQWSISVPPGGGGCVAANGPENT